MTITPQHTSALALMALASAIAGCGGSERAPRPVSTATPAANSAQRQILATVDALQAASHKGDGKSICDQLFTAGLVRSIEKASKRSCAREVRRNLFSPREQISVSRDIRVAANRASAVIREQNGNASTLFFVKQGTSWRISRVVSK